MTKKISEKNNRKSRENDNDRNLFNEMAYEMAGDIGAIDNEDMLNNRKLVANKGIRKKRNSRS